MTARRFRASMAARCALIMPRWYLWKSRQMAETHRNSCAADKPGFWETRGYHNEGDPWTEQRYG